MDFEKTFKKYDKYRNSIKWMLVWSGMWPNDKKHPLLLKIFLASFMNLIGFAFSISSLYNATKARNMAGTTKCIGLFIGAFSVNVRMAALLLNRKKLQKLNEGLSVIFHENMEAPENQPLLFAHFHMMYKIYQFFVAALSIHFFASIIQTLIKAFQGKYTRMFPETVFKDLVLDSENFWVVFAIELMFAFSVWIVNCGGDMSFGLYTLHLVGELKLLTHKFRVLIASENYKEDIKLLVDRHCELLEAHHILEDIYSLLVMWLAVTCAVTLCISSYQITIMHEWNVFRIFYFVTWAGMKLSQTYFISFIGDVISEESEECSDAIYDNSWSTNPKYVSIRNDMLIIMSQRPLDFGASGMLVLDFKLFSKLLKTAWSYYCLIQTLETK